MKISRVPPSVRHGSARKPTNLSIRRELVEDARALGINMSDVVEGALLKAIAEARAAAWLTENRPALESSNAWVAAHGLPLADKRLF